MPNPLFLKTQLDMPVRSNKKETLRDVSPENRLVGLATEFLRFKTDEAKYKKEKDSRGTLIKGIMRDPEVHELSANGHFEKELQLGDGLNMVHIQLQNVEIVSTVPDLLKLLEDKLSPDRLAPYIYTERRLTPNALEQMHLTGLLSLAEIEELTTVKKQERLIIKANKKRK